MSRRTIIVDGYNVIMRTPALRPDANRTLRESREKLVNLLSWAMGGDRAKFLVVFDGAQDVGPAEQGPRVEVRFSKPPLKADDVIREIVEVMVEKEERVTVVTADLEVARHARAMGADIALSDLFLASALGSAGGGETTPEEKPPSLSKKEIEAWAEIFKSRRVADDDEDPATLH